MTNEGAKRYSLYVLKLEQDKWYVGITAQTPEKRFQQHLNGIWAADWTKKYKPLQIERTEDLGVISKEDAECIEHQRTRELMKIYGWKNVRGGRFRSLEYKKYFGILWRTNVDSDMPTLETLYALILASSFIAISCYLLYMLYR